jgi:hypothetical protein
MTVEELIEELKKFEPKLKVVIIDYPDEASGYFDVTDIKFDQETNEVVLG